MNKFLLFFKNQDIYYSFPILFSLLSIFFIVSSLAVSFTSLPPKLPLFYSLPWGESQLTNKNQIIILPALIILVTLVHSFITFHLHNIHFVLKRILMLSVIFIDLIVLVTTVKIILVSI